MILRKIAQLYCYKDPENRLRKTRDIYYYIHAAHMEIVLLMFGTSLALMTINYTIPYWYMILMIVVVFSNRVLYDHKPALRLKKYQPCFQTLWQIEHAVDVEHPKVPQPTPFMEELALRLIRDHLHDVPGCERLKIRAPSIPVCLPRAKMNMIRHSPYEASGVSYSDIGFVCYGADATGSKLATLVHELVHDYTHDEGMTVFITAALLQYSGCPGAYADAMYTLSYRYLNYLRNQGAVTTYDECALYVPPDYHFMKASEIRDNPNSTYNLMKQEMENK